MGISLKPRHLKRYKDIALFLIRYGRADIVRHAGLHAALPGEDQGPAVAEGQRAGHLAHDLEQLGPTFIKIGQLLSTRSDFLPPAYIQALTRLQDKIASFSYQQVEAIVQAELGTRISKAFAHFERKPMAAASLGQVHRALLHDGRSVVVKVQRPGIQGQVADDLAVLEELAAFLDRHTSMGKRYELGTLLQEFSRTLWRELDYRQEARHLRSLHENLRDFTGIVVPTPIEDYTTGRVLTMEYIHGRKITALSPLSFLEIDGSRLAEQLFHAYLRQILVDGFFHADPHPGNVFLTDDHRLALLDLGMVGHISPQLQENLLQLVLAVSDGRGDDASAIFVKMSQARPDFSEPDFRRTVAALVGEHQSSRLEQIDVGQVVLEMTRLSGQSGLRVPAELTLLGKTLLNLDLIARTLDPAFDPNAAVRHYSQRILQQRMKRALSPANLLGDLLEIKDLIVRFPGRINRILDAVAHNELKVKVDTIDELVIIQGLQKIANRITTGLILAALIVGAAMLMQVQTAFRIFGYPGFAILCFLLAAGSGLLLIVRILMQDRSRR